MDAQRHQQGLQAVLRFAIENSECAGRLDPSQCGQMENERRQFLENALKSMTVDVIEELEKTIRCLESDTSTVESKVEALNVVRDYADNLDFANNFIQIGGSKVVIDCLKSSFPKLRICSAYVIAELAQNNPFCQKHFIDAHILQVLILYTKEGGEVASSSMHAISSLVRNYEEGSVRFIEMGGLECIVERLRSGESNVFVKSCFLLRALATEYTAVRDKFVKLGAVSALASFIDPVIGFDLKIETVLSALIVLTEKEEGILDLQKAKISEILKNIVKKNNGKAECEEILRDSTALLDRLQENKEN